jgi:ribosomal protein S18 acetylase RimI-like enzyme
MMHDYDITKSSEKETAYVRNKLLQFNAKNVPSGLVWNYREVNLTVKNETDEIIGGLLSVICWNWLEIDILWVDEKYRGLGYGSQLLREAEEISKQSKCTFIKLNTFSFQAPSFYEKHGYREIAVIEDAPIGFSHHYFKKDISRYNGGRSTYGPMGI